MRWAVKQMKELESAKFEDLLHRLEHNTRNLTSFPALSAAQQEAHQRRVSLSKARMQTDRGAQFDPFSPESSNDNCTHHTGQLHRCEM